MPLIDCKNNHIMIWSADCFTSSALTKVTGLTKVAIIHTKFYVLVETLSTHGNGKLLQDLKSGFKTKIDWNKHQSKITMQA